MACRECGRQPYVGNMLDGEGYHERGCESPSPMRIPACVGCGRMPWSCDCDLGPWFEYGPLSEDDYEARLRLREGP